MMSPQNMLSRMRLGAKTTAGITLKAYEHDVGCCALRLASADQERLMAMPFAASAAGEISIAAAGRDA